MKPLLFILLLLFSLQTYGQEGLGSSESSVPDSITLVLLNKHCGTRNELFFSYGSRPITWQDLFDYAKECYDDSSFVHCFDFGKGWQTFDPSLVDVISFYYPHRQMWIHRDPTFPGFIEFLRAK